MTKQDLIAKMAKDASITPVAARTVLESIFTNITKELKKKDGKLTLVGFGAFRKVRCKARNGRNPQTGEKIRIKARNVVRFRPGKKLKETIN